MWFDFLDGFYAKASVPYRGSNHGLPAFAPACCQLHHMNFSPIVYPVLTLHGFPFNIVNATLLTLCRWFRSGEPRSRSPSTSLRTICFQGSPGTPVRLTLHILIVCPPGGTRTHTSFRTRDPKSRAYYQFRHQRIIIRPL